NNCDDRGLKWPVTVAPYHVHVVATGKDRAVFDTGEDLSTELSQAGVEVLYDDRVKVSPGVKFADAGLLGVHYIILGGRRLAKGVVEVRDRRSGQQVEMEPGAAVEHLQHLVRTGLDH